MKQNLKDILIVVNIAGNMKIIKKEEKMNEQLTFEFNKVKAIKGYPELHWTGKRAYTSTQYYPAQLKEIYGQSKHNWMNKIFWEIIFRL